MHQKISENVIIKRITCRSNRRLTTCCLADKKQSLALYEIRNSNFHVLIWNKTPAEYVAGFNARCWYYKKTLCFSYTSSLQCLGSFSLLQSVGLSASTSFRVSILHLFLGSCGLQPVACIVFHLVCVTIDWIQMLLIVLPSLVGRTECYSIRSFRQRSDPNLVTAHDMRVLQLYVKLTKVQSNKTLVKQKIYILKNILPLLIITKWLLCPYTLCFFQLVMQLCHWLWN